MGRREGLHSHQFVIKVFASYRGVSLFCFRVCPASVFKTCISSRKFAVSPLSTALHFDCGVIHTGAKASVWDWGMSLSVSCTNIWRWAPRTGGGVFFTGGFSQIFWQGAETGGIHKSPFGGAYMTLSWRGGGICRRQDEGKAILFNWRRGRLQNYKTTRLQLQNCKNARLQNYMGAHMTLPWLLRNLLYMGRMRAKEYCSLEYERNRRVIC